MLSWLPAGVEPTGYAGADFDLSQAGLFAQLLAEPERFAPLNWLVVAEPVDLGEDPATAAPVYLAADRFVTDADETQADTWFQPRLMPPVFRYARAARGLAGLLGEAGASFGAIPVANGDRGLDAALPPARGWDGRDVTIYMGGRGFRFGDYGRVATLQARAVTASPTGFEIVIDDLDRLLDQPIATETYGGTGGLDGAASIGGQLHPYGAGVVRHAEPVALGSGIYEFNGVASDALLAVRVGGNDDLVDEGPVTDIEAASPSPGAFMYDLGSVSGRSYIRFGTVPQSVVTVDFRGDATGAGYVSRPGSVLARILGRLGTPFPLDAGSFGTLDGRAPYDIGWYARERVTAREVLDRAMLGLFGIWGRRRSGALAVDILQPPGSPVASFDERSILAIERLETPPPIRSLRYGYRPRWRPLSEGEVVGAAEADRPAQTVANSWSDPLTDADIAARHPLADALDLPDGLVDDGTAAAAVRDRGWSLLSVERSLLRVTLRTQPFVREIGETIRLTSPRMGLDGWSGRIVGIDEQAGPPRVQVEVWG